MAYVSDITKVSVSQDTDVDFIVTVHVSIEDDSNPGVVIKEKDVSARWNSGTTVPEMIEKLEAKMFAGWDKFIAEWTLYNAAAFTNAIATMKADLDTYINS